MPIVSYDPRAKLPGPVTCKGSKKPGPNRLIHKRVPIKESGDGGKRSKLMKGG